MPKPIPQRDIVSPKLMRDMIEVGSQQAQGFEWQNRFRRKRWVRDDSDESGLSKGTGCPSRFVVSGKPILRDTVVGMTLPRQSDEDVNIEQERRHSSSDSSSLIRLDVIRGSGATSKTSRPFTMRVGVGARNPLRTSSETALPRAKERLSA